MLYFSSTLSKYLNPLISMSHHEKCKKLLDRTGLGHPCCRVTELYLEFFKYDIPIKSLHFHFTAFHRQLLFYISYSVFTMLKHPKTESKHPIKLKSFIFFIFFDCICFVLFYKLENCYSTTTTTTKIHYLLEI